MSSAELDTLVDRPKSHREWENLKPHEGLALLNGLKNLLKTPPPTLSFHVFSNHLRQGEVSFTTDPKNKAPLFYFSWSETQTGDRDTVRRRVRLRVSRLGKGSQDIPPRIRTEVSYLVNRGAINSPIPIEEVADCLRETIRNKASQTQTEEACLRARRIRDLLSSLEVEGAKQSPPSDQSCQIAD